MAKVRHRVFEIYESVDESILELTSRTEKVTPDSSDPDTWTFQYLDVKREAGVTLVQFTESQLAGEEVSNGLREDFLHLGERINKDNRLLVDFSNVESVNPGLLTVLASFSKKLRTKGSRMVVCGLKPSVHAVFFAGP